MSFGGTTKEDAIVAWLTAASGVAVIWAGQGAGRPAPPYLAINVIGLNDFGQDWQRIDVDTETIYHEGPREVALSIQCFAVDVLGVASAVNILNKIMVGKRNTTIAAALLAAGVAIRRFDGVSGLGAIVGASEWEPRAVVTAYLSVGSSVAETDADFIETVATSEV